MVRGSCGQALFAGRKAVQFLFIALLAASLAACAQSPVVNNKTASLATKPLALLGPNHTASIGRSPLATNNRSGGAPGAMYGVASFYTEGSQTANGEKFDGRQLTAAHATLPFGTRVRITNVTNGRSVTVRINDRGPFVPGRVVDVSYSAAESLGMTERGIAKVKLEVVQ
jgi:rare lipoprotein A